MQLDGAGGFEGTVDLDSFEPTERASSGRCQESCDCPVKLSKFGAAV
jgi:hypothetical protein